MLSLFQNLINLPYYADLGMITIQSGQIDQLHK